MIQKNINYDDQPWKEIGEYFHLYKEDLNQDSHSQKCVLNKESWQSLIELHSVFNWISASLCIQPYSLSPESNLQSDTFVLSLQEPSRVRGEIKEAFNALGNLSFSKMSDLKNKWDICVKSGSKVTYYEVTSCYMKYDKWIEDFSNASNLCQIKSQLEAVLEKKFSKNYEEMPELIVELRFNSNPWIGLTPGFLKEVFKWYELQKFSAINSFCYLTQSRKKFIYAYRKDKDWVSFWAIESGNLF